MLFKQIRGQGSNYSYVIADENTREAAVVDPDFNVKAVEAVLSEEKLRLLFVIDTHDHVDHVVGNDELKLHFGAKTVAHKLAKIAADISVDDGDVIRVGSVSFKVIYTPGHSVDSISLLIDGKKLLTGDTLLVGGVGGISMGGSLRSLYESIFLKLLPLSDDVELFPGHDRGTGKSSTLGKEKSSNKLLKARIFEEFVELTKDA